MSVNQQKIMVIINQNPKITSEEMSQLIEVRADTIRKNILTLKKLGFVERIGSLKGGSWKIKLNDNNIK